MLRIQWKKLVIRKFLNFALTLVVSELLFTDSSNAASPQPLIFHFSVV